jgi:2,4-dienoyl-CoA reductase-like NADH-dependent reductase (Old Yellow Enzyme family)
VDVIDCTSGGIGGPQKPDRMPLTQGFQVPFADQVKKEAGIATMAVGFIWDATFADQIIREGPRISSRLLANYSMTRIGLCTPRANWDSMRIFRFGTRSSVGG